MITIIQANGTIVKTQPDRVYQGSNKANQVVLIGAYAQNLIPQISFKLPQSADYTSFDYMIPADIPTNEGISVWTYDLPLAVTQEYGNVKYQINVEDSDGVIVASGICSFEVERGNLPDTSNIPDLEPLETIKQILQQLYAIYENGDLLSKGLLPFDLTYNYPLNATIFDVNTKDFYVSLVDNNIGNELTDTTKWVKQSFVKQNAIENITSNQVKISNSSGGFAAGSNAQAMNGGAIGKGATDADGGGAVGDSAYTTTGGAVGAGARTSTGGTVGFMSSSSSGGAVGAGTYTSTGGAVGAYARADDGGGAVGANSVSKSGFAGGNNAKANADGAVQLGEGTNNTPNTFQFRSFPVLDANGKVIKDRLPAEVFGSTIYGGTFNGDGIITASIYAAELSGMDISEIDLSKYVSYYFKCNGESYLLSNEEYHQGDVALCNGDIQPAWTKFDNTDQVTSVNGKTGAVVLNKEDVGLTIDAKLSTTSENPVQNKVISNALGNKIAINEVVSREAVPTASSDTPDFVQTDDGLVYKKSTTADGNTSYSYEAVGGGRGGIELTNSSFQNMEDAIDMWTPNTGKQVAMGTIDVNTGAQEMLGVGDGSIVGLLINAETGASSQLALDNEGSFDLITFDGNNEGHIRIGRIGGSPQNPEKGILLLYGDHELKVTSDGIKLDNAAPLTEANLADVETVKSVNSKTPDDNGNVTITSTDLGLGANLMNWRTELSGSQMSMLIWNKDDVVLYNSILYICILGYGSMQTSPFPDADPTHWKPLTFTSGGSSSQTFTDINSTFQFIQSQAWEKIIKLIFIPTNAGTFTLSSNIISIPIDGTPSLQTSNYSYAATTTNTPIVFYPQTKQDAGFDSFVYQFAHRHNNANLLLNCRTTSDGSISFVTAIGNFVNATSSSASIGSTSQTQFQSNLVGSFIVCYET